MPIVFNAWQRLCENVSGLFWVMDAYKLNDGILY